MPQSNTPSPGGPPVLLLGHSQLAWQPAGPDSLVQAPLPEGGPAEWVRAASELIRGAGLRPRACVLALGEGHIDYQRLELPAHLPDREVKEILQRRSTAALGGEPPLFSALQLKGDRKLAGATQQGWLVLAANLERHRELSLELRSAGLAPRRIVPIELAPLALEACPEGDSPSVVVSFLGDGVGVTLLCEDGLVDKFQIPVKGLDPDALASSLVQELRSIDSSWRKQSQGGSLGRVHFVGFHTGWADRIGPPVSLVLPDAELEYSPSALPGAFPGGLDAVLTACRATSELVPELGLSLEPARRSRVALAALCVSAVATLGMYLGQGLSARADSAELELQMLARPEGELQRLTAEVAQAEAIRAEYAAQTQAIVGTARLGLPLEQLLAGAFGALQAGGGALESFEATPVDGVVEVRVQAQAPAGTREASWAMARSLSGLQATAGFSDLDLLPEERVPDRGEDESGSVTKFEIQGTWGGAR